MGVEIQQKVIFVTLYFGFMTFIFAKKSFSFMIPTMARMDELDKESIGSVLSALAVGYAFGKFVGGILVDTYSPKYMFSAGLITCGGINIAFSIASSISLYRFLWFLNGLFQGFGWPCCAKLLRRWYSKEAFGSVWSLLSTSFGVAASIGPYLCNAVTDRYGSWRYCMRGFGIASFIATIFVLLFVQDIPIATTNEHGKDAIHLNPGPNGREISPGKDRSEKGHVGLAEALRRIFLSPFAYVVSAGFFVSLLCRITVVDWGPLYLISEKQAEKESAFKFSGTLELGGILGSILSGFVTDWIVSKRRTSEGQPRILFLIPCTVTLVVSMNLLRNAVLNVTEQHAFTMVLAFIIGFSVYAIISVMGVITIESSASDISGRSHAVAGLFGNVGLASGGLPFSAIVENYSWSSAFFLIECAVVLLCAVLVCSQTMSCRIGDLKKKSD